MKSSRLMKRARVVLTPEQREVACREVVRSLLSDRVEVIDVCISAKHWHALVRFEPKGSKPGAWRSPRHLIGRAKGRSARVLSKLGLTDIGGVWAVRCRPMPVKNRAHQINLAKYIRKHAKKGAAVYSLLKRQWEAQGLSPGLAGG